MSPRQAAVSFSTPSVTEDDIEAVTDVLRSGWLTTGEVNQAFEKELAAHLQVDHVVTVASCTHALEICLHRLGLPAGSRIGVPTWTFASTALAAVHVGHVPVLLDVEPTTLNVSVASLEASLDGLDAVIPVHFGGAAVDERVHEVCAAAGVPVIEDAAHAFGTTDASGVVNGSRSAGACFSFYATKNLTTAEGGAIGTNDESLAEFAHTFRLHGLSRDAWKRYRPESELLYDVVAPGIKANMPDVLAALGRSQLRRAEQTQRTRRQLVERYRSTLDGIGELEFVPCEPDPGSADHLMVVLLPAHVSRTAIVKHLAAAGVGTSVHFQPLHTLEWLGANAEIGRSGVAVADRLAPRAMSLPLHTELTADDVDRVCSVLAEALSAHT